MVEQLRPATAERRRAIRFVSKLTTPCRIRRATLEGRWDITVRNISSTGIGLTANRPFRPGMLLTLEMFTSDQKRVVRLVRVKHSRILPGKLGWATGGRFVRPLDHDDLNALGDHAPALVKTDERRQAARHSSKLRTTCLLTRAAEVGLWYAKIRNVSKSGLALIGNRPFPAGTYLTVDLPATRPTLKKARLVLVRHAERQPGNHWWVLGTIFLRPLTDDELAGLR